MRFTDGPSYILTIVLSRGREGWVTLVTKDRKCPPSHHRKGVAAQLRGLWCPMHGRDAWYMMNVYNLGDIMGRHM